MKEFDVVSDRKFFRVTFKSNDRLDGTGFNASYVFLDEEENYTVKAPTNEAIPIRCKKSIISSSFERLDEEEKITKTKQKRKNEFSQMICTFNEKKILFYELFLTYVSSSLNRRILFDCE